MSNATTETMTARRLLDLARAGQITAELTDEESLPPMADASGSDCYPTCEITLTAGDWSAELTGWKAAGYEEGPNRRSTGAYIGDGWHLIVSRSDGGCNHGGIRVKSTADGIIIHSGDNVGEDVDFARDDLTEDEAEELVGLLQEAVDGVYGEWRPKDADDSDIREKLVDHRTRRGYSSDKYAAEISCRIDTSDGQEDITVGIFTGVHAGMPVYAVDGDEDEELFNADAEGAAKRARRILRERLEKAAEKVGEMDIKGIVSALERAGDDD